MDHLRSSIEGAHSLMLGRIHMKNATKKAAKKAPAKKAAAKKK